MSKFAFIVHPVKAKDARRKYPVMGLLPDPWIERLLEKLSTKVASRVEGVVSNTGQTVEGIFIGLPLTPAMFLRTPVEECYRRIEECCRIAANEGADIIGLGAFTAVIGDGGITVAKNSPIPVTTGNSYTVATAIEGAMKAASLVGIEPSQSTLAVVGATGSIGRTCARVMAPQFQSTLVIGRDPERIQLVAEELPRATASVQVEDIARADLVVTVTSSDTAIIEPRHLKKGAVVCDVSRPRDVSVRVVKERPDVLVVEGGVVKVPGSPDFGLDFGFPPGTAYACMCETMMLAMENRFESYTLGKDVSVEQVEETQGWATKHGFTLEGFRAFEKAVTEEQIDRCRRARQGG